MEIRLQSTKKKTYPETLSAENKEQIKLAMKGNDTTPRKIVVYVLAKTEEDYRKALEYFEIKKSNMALLPNSKNRWPGRRNCNMGERSARRK
ncbi:MAG: hypothetical protein ACLRH0_07055 [Blautia wexlerae]